MARSRLARISSLIERCRERASKSGTRRSSPSVFGRECDECNEVTVIWPPVRSARTKLSSNHFHFRQRGVARTLSFVDAAPSREGTRTAALDARPRCAARGCPASKEDLWAVWKRSSKKAGRANLQKRHRAGNRQKGA